jgi:uncharacterized membrane protein
MISRCTNPKSSSWDHYGAIGISVCNRWLNSFENFLADMGETTSDLSLDRIDVYGNYEPGNCRWATWKQQRENQRKIAPCACPNCGYVFTPIRKRSQLAKMAREKCGFGEERRRWRRRMMKY